MACSTVPESVASKEDVGVAKTHVALDMSWLRLERSTDINGKVSYSFGKGGYVKKFHMEEPLEFRYVAYPKYTKKQCR